MKKNNTKVLIISLKFSSEHLNDSSVSTIIIYYTIVYYIYYYYYILLSTIIIFAIFKFMLRI